MIIDSFPDLITAYLEEHLKGKASYSRQVVMAAQWIRTLTTTPTRAQILERHRRKGHGHFQKGACQANTEFALLRAACRWGMYQERWEGGDPTVGIKKWKTAKRKRVSKFEEIMRLRRYFDGAVTDTEIRDRALFGLMLFTGCRPGEARKAPLHAITPYGEMGSWIKGQTKTGENQEVPLPTQLMPWLAAWKAIRPASANPYLFPGRGHKEPLDADSVVRRWHELRLMLGINGLWNYDLRRSLATHLSNELHYDDVTIRAILNHSDGSALSHYCFKSFDSLVKPIQEYADWLCGLKQASNGGSREPVLVSAVAPTMPSSMPIVRVSRTVEREEWPG
jgi:integrase